MTFKKKTISQVVAVALCGTFAAAAQAAPVVISNFNTSAAIADAGYFSATAPGGLGLSFMGREFVNHGTWASNYSLSVGGSLVAVADEAVGGDTSNPLGAVAIPVGTAAEVNTNLPFGAHGWTFTQTVSIPSDGHVSVMVNLTNNSGATASDVLWGVGVDPDQGIPVGGGFGTTNEILATGVTGTAVRATSSDGYSLTLRNTTSAGADAIAAYVDTVFGSCCAPIDPAFIFATAQGVGSYGFADHSINLAFDLGDIAPGETVTFGYEYVMAVPEPETYAMLLAGLGLIGFSLRRRSA